MSFPLKFLNAYTSPGIENTENDYFIYFFILNYFILFF